MSTVFPLKLNGDMRHGLRQRQPIAFTMIRVCSVSMAGITATREGKPTPFESSRKTLGDCMTCMVMSGSGYRIGMGHTPQHRRLTHKDLKVVLRGLCAAVRSATRPRTCAPLAGAPAGPSAGARTTGSVVYASRRPRLDLLILLTHCSYTGASAPVILFEQMDKSPPLSTPDLSPPQPVAPSAIDRSETHPCR